MNQLINKKDILLIAVVLVVGFVLLGIRTIRASEGAYAEITTSYGITKVALGTDRVFSLPQLPNIEFEVRGGQIAFIRSDCPDQICVHTGFLSRSGRMAACLPNSVILFILQSGEEDELDIFVR